MLDECRHFFGTEAVKKLLDNMAMLKLNKFHWHLSDDQGFRIESKLFPRLNEIGSKREYAGLEGLGLKHRGGEYFYYYKQDEIKNIVAYAAKLNIEVIPEIDLPGHASALLAAYPELPVSRVNSSLLAKTVYLTLQFARETKMRMISLTSCFPRFVRSLQAHISI